MPKKETQKEVRTSKKEKESSVKTTVIAEPAPLNTAGLPAEAPALPAYTHPKVGGDAVRLVVSSKGDTVLQGWGQSSEASDIPIDVGNTKMPHGTYFGFQSAGVLFLTDVKDCPLLPGGCDYQRRRAFLLGILVTSENTGQLRILPVEEVMTEGAWKAHWKRYKDERVLVGV